MHSVHDHIIAAAPRLADGALAHLGMSVYKSNGDDVESREIKGMFVDVFQWGGPFQTEKYSEWFSTRSAAIIGAEA